MKKIKAFLLTILITIGFCSAIIYTSCNKSTCTGIVCQNGGLCLSGSCSCPVGYTGTFCDKATSSNVAYKNNTFTPITIAINGVSETIPVGGTVSFKGSYGTIASGVASTSGSTPLGVITGGGVVGETINWQLNDPFPTSGTVTDTLNIGASFFYLAIVNKEKSVSIINYIVNNGLTTGMLPVTATIPNNGERYGLGYYHAYPNSDVQVYFSDGTNPGLTSFSLPFVNNQIFVANYGG